MNLQQQLPEDLTVQQVARILDLSVYAVRKLIDEEKIESESMDIVPTGSVGNYMITQLSWVQEAVEQHIYNTIFE